MIEPIEISIRDSQSVEDEADAQTLLEWFYPALKYKVNCWDLNLGNKNKWQ